MILDFGSELDKLDMTLLLVDVSVLQYERVSRLDCQSSIFLSKLLEQLTGRHPNLAFSRSFSRRYAWCLRNVLKLNSCICPTLKLDWERMQPDSPKDEPPQPPSDGVLFQALMRGEPSALAMLYDRYASLVYGLAIRILQEPQAAEDLTQEVFLTLWRNKNYDPVRGSLSAFLITLTRSRAIDKLRSQGAKLKFLDRWSQDMSTQSLSDTPFEQVSLAERSQKVREALAELPESQRQVLEMAYYEGLSQTEIAARIATPLGTVKTRARQGLLKLRQTLQDWIS